MPALIPKPEPVILTGNELGEFPDTLEGKKALRAAAKKHLMAMRGEWVECPALNAAVELRKIGIEKFISLSGDPRKLKLAAAIKQLIHSGRKVGSGASYAPDIEQNIKAYHYLRTETLLNGKSIAVRIVVREDQQGVYHYDMTVHGVDETLIGAQEKSPTGVGLDSATTSNAGGVADESVKPSQLASCQLDSILDHGKEYVNIFIEGEEPEAIENIADPVPALEPVASDTASTTLESVAAQYGYSIVDGELVTPLGKNTDVVIDKPKKGRILIHGKNGQKLFTFSASKPDDLGKFLEKYWYAKKVSQTNPSSIQPTEPTPAPIALPYNFAHASDEFKAWVAESVDKESYSPFATAKAMDEAAIRNGAIIEWGMFDGAKLDSVFIDDDGNDWSDEEDWDDGNEVFDASDHWKQQPRNRRSGRWELRRGKRIKNAVQGALRQLSDAAARANDYVTQSLANKKSGSHSGAAALAAVGHGAAAMDPGAAAIGELIGHINSVTRTFDSVVFDAVDADSPSADGYVGKVKKDGELAGIVAIADDGKAMVYFGEDFNTVRVRGNENLAEWSDDDAPLMIDWLFMELAYLNSEEKRRKAIEAQNGELGKLSTVEYLKGKSSGIIGKLFLLGDEYKVRLTIVQSGGYTFDTRVHLIAKGEKRGINGFTVPKETSINKIFAALVSEYEDSNPTFELYGVTPKPAPKTEPTQTPAPIQATQATTTGTQSSTGVQNLDQPLENNNQKKDVTLAEIRLSRLDAIYQFNATPEFKKWVADYLDAPAPNPCQIAIKKYIFSEKRRF